MYMIANDLELKNAEDVTLDLLSEIESQSSGVFALDIGDGTPSQIALQIGFAAIKELERRQIELKRGPALEAALGMVADKKSS